MELESRKIAFTLDKTTNKMHREGLFDPAVHSPQDERDEVEFRLTPLDPRFPVVTRPILFPSKEATLVKEAMRDAGLRPSDVNGAYIRMEWVPNGKVLGTYPARDGTTRERTYLAIREKYPDEATCRTAWEASRTGAGADESPNVLADGAAPPAGLTDAERAERSTLVGFLTPLAKGKTYDQFTAAIAADPRLSRFFRPDDPEVVDVLTRLGIARPASEA
jgi:hypothetical protein